MATILFVDDEPLTRKLLAQAAQILGHRGLTAATAEEALESADSDRPDLIVTDINLNGVHSLDLIEQLHTAPKTRSIPVITLSAEEPGDIQAQAQARGAVASLEKPVRLQTLLEVIREHAPKS
ncbi:MAG TPA: response regulator [Anaerolineales bacterium]|jgi:CheY-like chemotaxis protein